jgi:hypothetical protein
VRRNAATQFFGLLNAPVQIAAAREMAQAKGGDVPDVSLLKSGQDYAAVECRAFAKVSTPLCLSYHPKAPLITEEVIARARKDAWPVSSGRFRELGCGTTATDSRSARGFSGEWHSLPGWTHARASPPG